MTTIQWWDCRHNGRKKKEEFRIYVDFLVSLVNAHIVIWLLTHLVFCVRKLDDFHISEEKQTKRALHAAMMKEKCRFDEQLKRMIMQMSHADLADRVSGNVTYAGAHSRPKQYLADDEEYQLVTFLVGTTRSYAWVMLTQRKKFLL